MKNSIKEIKNELVNTGNRVDQMEKKNSDINGKNLEMVHREEKRDLNIKKKKNSMRTI